ncbi:tetratricopeptide repeat protein [Denitrobaculum tricleocarpae]|uniref:Tetratricopeptide repeat protein 38 n=1 Tax=Denitrobaculum tricleocarpae TaxID=2591009 RepID=A0A545TFD4_9PROT|nr:tetratricopeptide repeat protein [Denitrobaculum tricleocarpae]TQV75891.1 tetratricopeptide repeat protein [Denitrobaculum tricleocarpae]
MSAKDPQGYSLTGANEKASELYAQALTELQCYIDDPVATIDAALAESPNFVMAHCFRAYLHLLASERAAMPEAEASFKAVTPLPANDRETGHIAAIQQFLAGDMQRGINALESVLIDYPLDIVALQTAHLFDFFVGDARSLRDRVARQLPQWSGGITGYHALLGMYAFGLEEMGDYRRAEDYGHQAIDLNTRDAWAQHAVAHVYEMEGRQQQGIDWMESRQVQWSTDNFMSVHNWWHLAMYYLDLGQIERVLNLYDTRIRVERSEVALDMVDASAMLWRLHLRGVELGDRWNEIAKAWSPVAEDAFYAFNDFHAMMAFVGSGNAQDANRVLTAQKARIGKGGSNDAMTAEVGYPLCMALQAFSHGDYARTIELIRPLRTIANRFGGSHAQRDVIDLTLIESAFRDGQHGLARALSNERMALKPTSPLNAKFRRRLAQGTSAQEEASVA